MNPEKPKQTIAVVGCGVAGLTAGWLLGRKHDVEFFEKNEYAGGHTRTLIIPDGPDAGTPVDTGFIVMNHRNYPLFTEVLRQLEVDIADSSMTFSYHDCQSGYAYSGDRITTLFPNLSYFANRDHCRMVFDLWRFAKIGYADLQSGFLSGWTLGEYCQKRSFSQSFLEAYLYPMGAAIWSSPIEQMHAFPAEPYLHFLENHGLLRLINRPQWKYVCGGSQTYVRAMLKQFGKAPELNAAPRAIQRKENGVSLFMPDGRVLDYDHVVIATHADEALGLLADPTKEEAVNLGPWRYQGNRVTLHTDDSHLPPQEKLWASWNFAKEEGHEDARPVSVSYYMNRLQRLETEYPYIVTLNNTREIDPSRIINSTTLTHPLYSFDSMHTQSKLRTANGQRNTWFCGSYFGYGFHEDAVQSAVEVAQAFGIPLEQAPSSSADPIEVIV
ncbi:MAG: NAD(P)/FAD-dependent oxidoreductase [Coraliomargaritaceae bacterium]